VIKEFRGETTRSIGLDGILKPLSDSDISANLFETNTATWYIKDLPYPVGRQTNVSLPDKKEKIAFFCSSVTDFTFLSLKLSITEHFQTLKK
jgi:hypothetical protein